MLARYAALGHEAYFSPATLIRERDLVFAETWLYAGLVGDFSNEPIAIETAGLVVTITHQDDAWTVQCDHRPAKIALCGSLVFFSLSPAPPVLEQYLAPFFETLRGLSLGLTTSDRRLTATIGANWKIMAENALDDYHTAAVHPKTLYPSMLKEGERRIELQRAGGHSLWCNVLSDADTEFWAKVATRLKIPQTGQNADYQHLFIFPNFYLASFHGAAFILHRLNPVADDCVSLEMNFLIPAPSGTTAQRALKRAILADFVAKADAVLQEDIAVCEAAQKGRPFAFRPSLLGAREQRIGDFQDAIVAALAQGNDEDVR